MIWKKITTDKNGFKELYVFRNGTLIYKRWLSYGYGVVLDLHGAFYPSGDAHDRLLKYGHKV